MNRIRIKQGVVFKAPYERSGHLNVGIVDRGNIKVYVSCTEKIKKTVQRLTVGDIVTATIDNLYQDGVFLNGTLTKIGLI